MKKQTLVYIEFISGAEDAAKNLGAEPSPPRKIGW